MAVTSVNYEDKVNMYVGFMLRGGTLTAIGDDFDVSRKTVRRCVDEVVEFLSVIAVGDQMVYNDQSVIVSAIDSPIVDNMPIAVRFNDGQADYVDLDLLMEENASGIPHYSIPATEHSVMVATSVDCKFTVGDNVLLSDSSRFANDGEDSANPSGVLGEITRFQDGHLSIIVDWDNDETNSYNEVDLMLASDVEEVEVAEEVVDNADYFVVAPQDSISIIRVDQETGEMETRNINKSSVSFAEIRALIAASQDREVLQRAFILMSTRGVVEAFSVGRVKVDPAGETVVFIKADGSERRVPEELAADIIETVRDYGAAESERLVKFLDKLMDNVSFKAIEGLYRFMKHNCIAINEDGSIQAWKGVTDSLYSARAGSIKDSPTVTVDAAGHVYNGNFGEETRVDRSEVDDDPDATCSHGLHVGNRSYASSWASTLIRVSVQPQDVVAVPKDYNGAKMRTCAYTPIEVIGKY